MKKEKNVRMEVNLSGDEMTLKITDEQVAKIPRVGSKICVIDTYPVNDDDEDEGTGKVKEDAIMGYSFREHMVKATVLNDELDTVTINGDFPIKLNDDMTLKTKKQMIFVKKDDAVEKFTSLTNASIKEVERREEILFETKLYLKEAIEKLHH